MKNIFLLATFFVLLINLSFGKDVDSTTAKLVAENFYLQTNLLTGAQIELSMAFECKFELQDEVNSADGEHIYYVFNVNANDGFVIVSGNDIVVPILGYSTKGACDKNNLPPAFQKWMEGYKQQIIFAIANEIEPLQEINSKWEKLINGTFNSHTRSSSVSPLLSTTWDQSPYYNAQCPGGCVTGCVATAMAQIMKYWNYPATGTGFHSYSENDYGTLSANFGNTTYNWGSMPNNVSSSNSAVATLMFHCGVSVDMDYGLGSAGGSSAQTLDVANALEAYFGYSTTVQGLYRSYYTDAQWISLLKTELDAGRPVQYAGTGTGGGHSFVCDGYDNSDFFHFNWGWSGVADGYFDIDALNPGTTGTGGGTGGFNTNQRAITGIQPPTGTVIPDLQLNSSITINPNPINFGLSFTVNADIYNNGSTSFSGDFCAALFTSSGVFVDYVETLTTGGNPLPPTYSYTGGITFSNPGMLAVPGNYYVGIYYRPTGGDWYLAGTNWYNNYIPVTIQGPYNPLKLYSNIVPTPSTFVQTQAASVNVNLYNTLGYTYFGQYEARLYDLSGNFVQTIATLNETNGFQDGYVYNLPYLTFSTASITATPGTYILTIVEKETGSSTWYYCGSDLYANPITINVVAPPLSPDIYEVNNAQATSYNLPLTYSSNACHKTTAGSNNHIGTDNDYYKIALASGYNYTVTARVHDSYNSGNGNTYTNDVVWSYNKGAGWSTAYDDVMTGNISVNGAGTVYFHVAPYFSGQTGTYLLDIHVTRVSTTTGINEGQDFVFETFPNPASDFIFINHSANFSIDKYKIVNSSGQILSELTAISNSLKESIDVSNLSNGIYFLEACKDEKIYYSKFVVSR